MTDGTYKFIVKMADGTYCEKYSKEACESAIKKNGLVKGGKGWNFEGNYVTKGCYAYKSGKFKGYAYYGTGGSHEANTNTPSSPKYRPDGYDCL